jgi:hypothetical protein
MTLNSQIVTPHHPGIVTPLRLFAEPDLFGKPLPPRIKSGAAFPDRAFWLSMILSENRLPPRIKVRGSFFQIMLFG